MARVEVYLEPHESPEDAQEMLLKAFLGQESGESHEDQFNQPAARAVFDKMIDAHDRMFEQMLREINLVIDEEVE